MDSSILISSVIEEDLLLHEEFDGRFNFKLCQSGTLVGVGFLQNKRYIDSYQKLNFVLIFIDYLSDLMKGLDEDSSQKKKYQKDLGMLKICILENLLLASKATQQDVEWDLSSVYRNLLHLKSSVVGEENVLIGGLYMEVSMFFLKKSNFDLSFKFCEMAERVYYPSSLFCPFDFLLSQRLMYIITFLSKPTQITPVYNPFHDMVRDLYLRSDWVDMECSFVDLLGPAILSGSQILSETILDAMLTRTAGVKGFWLPLQIKRAKILWGVWGKQNPDIQEAWFVRVVEAMDMIETPQQLLIDVLEDFTWVLVELRGKTDELLQRLIKRLETWLYNSQPGPPPGHCGRLQLMMGRLELIDLGTFYEGEASLKLAQKNLMESYGKNHPFQNILASEKDRAKRQLQRLQDSISGIMETTDNDDDETTYNNDVFMSESMVSVDSDGKLIFQGSNSLCQ